jgi:hypothetical protein
MYPDYFYSTFNFGIPWIWISFIYAILDYLYNLAMCSLLGGMLQIKDSYKTYKFHLNEILHRKFYTRVIKNYRVGSHKLTKDFLADKLSWYWPISVLAIPTAIYGISRNLITNGVLSLEKIGVSFQSYIVFPNNGFVQFFLWALAIALGMRTFYRYQKERSKTTWFSKIWIFSFSRTLLFNIPLAYMVLNIIYIWIQYSFSLSTFLSSNEIIYPLFHSDLMYGLKTSYNTVVTMGLSLTLLSFLPTIMLVREKEQKYSKMYIILIYCGIFAMFVLLGILISQFNQKLGQIQESALSFLQAKINFHSVSNIETIANLEYYSLISKLPGKFPIPAWFNILLSARTVALFFEVVRITSPAIFEANAIRILQKILEK